MRGGLIKSIILGLGIVGILLGVCAGPGWAENKSYTWKNVGFQSPVEFSGPEKLGMGAVFFTHPPNAAPKQAKFEITLVLIKAQQIQAMGMDEAGLLAYVKSTYLGTAKPAEGHKERTINGSPVKGEVLSKKIPKSSSLELYLIPLPDGGKLALGFTACASLAKDEAEKIAGAVAESIKLTK